MTQQQFKIGDRVRLANFATEFLAADAVAPDSIVDRVCPNGKVVWLDPPSADYAPGGGVPTAWLEQTPPDTLLGLSEDEAYWLRSILEVAADEMEQRAVAQTDPGLRLTTKHVAGIARVLEARARQMYEEWKHATKRVAK